MKSLRESLVLSGAKVLGLNQTVVKGGDSTFVLHIIGPLTPDLAGALRCRNQVFNLNDNPYPGLKSLALDHKISNSELSVAGRTSLFPVVVTGFTVTPDDAADGAGKLEVSFRLKFSSGRKELRSLVDAVKDNEFDLALMAMQGGLFDEPTAKGDGPDGGTKIDMGPGTGDDEPDEEEEEPPLPLVREIMDGNAGPVDEAIGSGAFNQPSNHGKRARRARGGG
jgi:hypothetical protein